MEEDGEIIGIMREEPLSITITVADNGYVIQSDLGIKVATTLRGMLRAVTQVVRDDETAMKLAFARAHADAREARE